MPNRNRVGATLPPWSIRRLYDLGGTRLSATRSAGLLDPHSSEERRLGLPSQPKDRLQVILSIEEDTGVRLSGGY